MSADNAPITGRHYITTIYDTLTLQRGNHTLKFGGNYRDTQWRDTSLDGAGSGGFLGLPRYSHRARRPGDPRPVDLQHDDDARHAERGSGERLQPYALLTGRLSQVQTGRVVDPATLQYSSTIYRENWTSAWFGGVFAQDSWRVTPNFTLNYGFRWEVGRPRRSTTRRRRCSRTTRNLLGPSTALFQPGELNGVTESGARRAASTPAATDWVNPAPRARLRVVAELQGAACSRRSSARAQKRSFRGGYDITYYDEGTNMFCGTAGQQPRPVAGAAAAARRAGLRAGGLTLQSAAAAVRRHAGGIQGRVESVRVHIRRDGHRDDEGRSEEAVRAGVEHRRAAPDHEEHRASKCVTSATVASNVWHTYNLNEVNIFENGFLQEFKNAQQNLAINLANGVTGFANNGLPGQVRAADLRRRVRRARLAAGAARGQGYTNGGFITNLQQGEAGRLAATLSSDRELHLPDVRQHVPPVRDRAATTPPGRIPMNFFLVNPYAIGGALRLVDDDSFTRYHGDAAAAAPPLRRRAHA